MNPVSRAVSVQNCLSGLQAFIRKLHRKAKAARHTSSTIGTNVLSDSSEIVSPKYQLLSWDGRVLGLPSNLFGSARSAVSTSTARLTSPEATSAFFAELIAALAEA